MPKIQIKLTDLENGWDADGIQMAGYLDAETGQVLLIYHDEVNRRLEALYAEESLGEDVELDDLLAAIDARDDMHDWQKAQLKDAARVEWGFPERYRRIEPDDTRTEYRDMEAFVESLPASELRRRLENAIDGRGAFSRFKNVLGAYPEQRRRWFTFKGARRRARIEQWLEDEGIDYELV